MQHATRFYRALGTGSSVNADILLTQGILPCLATEATRRVAFSKIKKQLTAALFTACNMQNGLFLAVVEATKGFIITCLLLANAL